MKTLRISADRETLQQLFDQLAPLYFPLQKELMLAIVDDMKRHDESWVDIEKYLPEGKVSVTIVEHETNSDGTVVIKKFDIKSVSIYNEPLP